MTYERGPETPETPIVNALPNLPLPRVLSDTEAYAMASGMPTTHEVEILDHPSTGIPLVIVDGVKQHDIVRYEITRAIGARAGVLSLYRAVTRPVEISGEFELVERVVGDARRNLHDAAIVAFAITDDPEVTRNPLADILRDAKRYRALRAANYYTTDGEQIDTIADEIRLVLINEDRVPCEPGGEDASAIRQRYAEMPPRDQYGDASDAPADLLDRADP